MEIPASKRDRIAVFDNIDPYDIPPPPPHFVMERMPTNNNDVSGNPQGSGLEKLLAVSDLSQLRFVQRLEELQGESSLRAQPLDVSHHDLPLPNDMVFDQNSLKEQVNNERQTTAEYIISPPLAGSTSLDGHIDMNLDGDVSEGMLQGMIYIYMFAWS